MTYDDWKTTDDTPEPERYRCEACAHLDGECDCRCCTDSADEDLCSCGHQLYLHDDGCDSCLECHCRRFTEEA